ncbi:hypothetical protein P8452_03439 [Trifolium repens]|nr:hypothetical protein P8452_03439 [Trifolium repens]
MRTFLRRPPHRKSPQLCHKTYLITTSPLSFLLGGNSLSHCRRLIMVSNVSLACTEDLQGKCFLQDSNWGRE